MTETTNFLPDWAVPPGSTIEGLLAEKSLSDIELAHDLGQPIDKVHQLLNGTAEITEEIALQLSKTFGLSEAFWQLRETQYRESLKRLETNIQWVNSFPIEDMVNSGWLHHSNSIKEKIAACLDFFNVPSVSDWYEHYENSHKLVAFRTSEKFQADEAATLAWLRQGEIKAGHIDCNPWNKEQFSDSLFTIRQLTREKSPSKFLPKLQEICAKSGVALVIEKAPKGCRASGATKFLSKNKALMMLSVRYLSDDHFWFTFFHEAGHLILHNSHLLFLEGIDGNTDENEKEANAFSSNLLVPSEYQKEMKALPIAYKPIMRFAKKIDIAPGIVVGQLQFHKKCPPNMLNRLKVRYTWNSKG
ncbi:hypothetical protein CYQ88_11265 [Hydrogenovibrio sp. SC-1]|uniref:ImmA/IrrE family metallo-endopeptidase n=1 Tax=Hydrogenovibrio sp. SC-1 TaxID=2065820 RepID=UPI000C7D3D6B|nr:ImmA/IrrE family metallo-endopeptidase [Hydrogenovibrio sp. SC-1]PLA73420.1 hypothetical protein CYQ88_11265 [Hydrogenovibrio sp. SC-1]